MALSKAADSRPHDETDPGRAAIPMDHYDRYLLPDPSGEREGLVPFTRSSTLKGRIQNSEALKAYNEKMIAKGFGIAPDLIALAASIPLSGPGAHQQLLDVVEEAKTRAGARVSANLGTALHGFTEAIDRGEPLADVLERVPERLRPDVEAYVRCLEENGLTPVPELVERVVVNTSLRTGLNHDGTEGTRKNRAAGVAARFDRMYRWTDPADGVEYLISGDLKTGKNAVAYGSLETCVQLAVAQHANVMFNEDTGSYEDMPRRASGPYPERRGHAGTDGAQYPRLRKDFGLMIHLPVGTGTCFAEELDTELGWKAAKLAEELMLLDKAKDHCHRPFGERIGGMITAAVRTLGGDEERPAYGTPPEAPTAPAEVQDAPQETGRLPLGSPETATALAEVRQQNYATAKDGSPLQPLKADGQRGCSVCSRIGHKKGSPKCWGDQDPAGFKAAGNQDFARQRAEAQESAFAQLPDPDAAPADTFTPEAEPVPHEKPAGPDCAHAAGFTRRTTSLENGTTSDVWVCAHCGQETPRAAEARQAREAMDAGKPETVPVPNGVIACGPNGAVTELTPEDAETVKAFAGHLEAMAKPEPVPDDVAQELQEEAAQDAEDEAELAEPSPAEDSAAAIAACESREELQALRKKGMAAGWWTSELTKLGLKRLGQLPR